MTKPKANPAAPASEEPKGTTLRTDLAGRTHDQFLAQAAAGGIVGNARSLVLYGKGTFGELSLSDCVKALKDTAQGLNNGDLSAAVTILSSQAAALDAMFAELARRSALNMGEYMDASERYMRLALKAQGQCRATLETLAAIKNPPVVFARQANIAHGPQQVNNGAAPGGGKQPARAANATNSPSGLLEQQHGQWLDPGAAGTAGGADTHLAPVGEVDRSEKR